MRKDYWVSYCYPLGDNMFILLKHLHWPLSDNNEFRYDPRQLIPAIQEWLMAFDTLHSWREQEWTNFGLTNTAENAFYKLSGNVIFKYHNSVIHHWSFFPQKLIPLQRFFQGDLLLSTSPFLLGSFYTFFCICFVRWTGRIAWFGHFPICLPRRQRDITKL